jgi:hypothetical protein
LFPFNRVFHVGATMVVDFNSVICPLAVVGEGGVTHAEVVAEIETIQDPAIVGTSLPGDDALIAREQAVATAMFAAAGFDAARTAIGSDPNSDSVVEAAFSTVFGMAWRLPSAMTVANAIALTPSMRFNELFGPRQYAPRDQMPPLLARMWLAWLGFAAFGEALAQRPLGLQELTTLWSEQASLMHVVARWDAVPKIKPGPFELPNIDPGNLVRGLGHQCANNKQSKRTLGELVASVMTTAEPVARVAALKLADPILRAAF